MKGGVFSISLIPARNVPFPNSLAYLGCGQDNICFAMEVKITGLLHLPSQEDTTEFGTAEKMQEHFPTCSSSGHFGLQLPTATTAVDGSKDGQICQLRFSLFLIVQS